MTDGLRITTDELCRKYRTSYLIDPLRPCDVGQIRNHSKMTVPRYSSLVPLRGAVLIKKSN